MALKVKSVNHKVKQKLDDKKSTENDNDANVGKSKHIIFDDDDNAGEVVVKKQQHVPSKSEKKRKDAIDIGKQWYQVFAEYNTGGELVELKNSEIEEITNHCTKCYEAEKLAFEKRNPSDVKWLKTALHKGTSRDRANAGALLVQSNPLANLDTLESLVTFTKVTNKNSTDSVDVVSDLFINALLPPDRKLLSFTLRGADWKALKKDDSVDKATKDQIFAYWYIETIIKDQYFEFLRNLQNAIQSGQDANKKQAIICGAKLLSYAPEKEQILLSMLVNKLGDPSRVIASKALHHLTEVSFKHPAMCGVICNETEKFLFRSNITEHAQHFAMCFLSQIAPHANVDVCTKLVNICLSFFEVVVNKGLINSKIMQAILLCLKHSITDVVEANKSNPGSDGGLLSKDTQDTIYRLVHFANIKVSLQTLALLLQIVTALGVEQQHSRFYNALYKKLLDPDLATCGTKYAALFLHIVHRAIHTDRNKSRSQAFIKRLLQVSLYLPAQMTCGCLIIINKIVKARTELNRIEIPVRKIETEAAPTENDESENASNEKLEKGTNYNPYHRVPEFAGGEFAMRTELLALLQHYHPTVRVFAQNIIDNEPIKFYGDPLIDFSLTHFLDRFAFKNPKKESENKPESLVQSFHNKHYKAHGSRGMPIKQLSTKNCTEEEKFIFQYLDKKRERKAALGVSGEQEDVRGVDDDEFDAHLDSLGSKKKGDDGLDDDDFDVLGDFGDKADFTGEGEEDWDSDDGDDGDDDEEMDDGESGPIDGDEFDDDGSDAGSISLDEDDGDDDDGSDIFESEDEDEENSNSDVSDPEDEPKSKRMKSMSGKDFQKKLKNTNNMNSLFAAVEDFSEMLEETSKSSKHGTLGEVFNKDKSSEKQIEWEAKRLKQGGNFGRKSKSNPKRNRSQGQKRRGETKQSAKKSIGGKRKHK